ncbi:hypothetical protein ACRALDRAFT_1068252 [Sodiomyces alcalophilus JCM 7366]|uniref:uncharacterized protein n=1 Tax=Sodiomyces alcalophilus JCM 7366 TaxID=591952 RepID=UPI0039B49702
MVERKLQAISEYNYTNNYIPTAWRAWNEGYFARVWSIARRASEPASMIMSGCTTDDWKTPNCTRTCSNATAMFSSPENVWNCMTLATVAMGVVPGSDTADPDNVKAMDDIFHFGTLEDVDGLDVFSHVRACFWQSCSDSKYGKCAPSLEHFKCEPINVSNMWDFGDVLLNDYCRHAEVGMDSDIAGPGVFIAYIMQHGLVLLLFLLFKLTANPSRNTASKRLKTWCTGAWWPPRKKESPFLRKLASRTTHAVHSAVFDLHEAQTLFVLTFTALWIIAFTDGYIGLANLESVGSYAVNSDISLNLAGLGMSPVLVLQLVLHRAGKRWGFTLSLMTINWVMITVYLLNRGSEYADPSDFWQTLKESSSVPACGNNPGPLSYCLGARSMQYFPGTLLSGFGMPFITCVLVWDWLLHSHGRIPWVAGHMGRLEKRVGGIWGEDRLANVKNSSFWDILWIIPQSLGLAMMVMGLYSLILLAIQFGTNSWGFGQLMVMTIWLPVVFKFIYSLFVGTKDGTEDRIHDDLEVREVGSPEPREQDDGGSETQPLAAAASRPSTPRREEWIGMEYPSATTGQGRSEDAALRSEDTPIPRKAPHTPCSPLEEPTSRDDMPRP